MHGLWLQSDELNERLLTEDMRDFAEPASPVVLSVRADRGGTGSDELAAVRGASADGWHSSASRKEAGDKAKADRKALMIR